jgi:hypothetical protein
MNEVEEKRRRGEEEGTYQRHRGHGSMGPCGMKRRSDGPFRRWW